MDKLAAWLDRNAPYTDRIAAFIMGLLIGLLL